MINDMNINLLLSGGGFRATLFHLGVVKRLYQLNLFKNIKTISSVSGGSILNGIIALNYDKIYSQNDFQELIENKTIDFVKKDIRNQIISHKISKIIPINWFKHNSTIKFAQILDKELFFNNTLENISDNVRTIFNATNINNGARWRFEKADFGDYKTGYSYDTKFIKLSEAVSASASYPLLFYPLKINTKNLTFYKRNFNKKDIGKSTNIPKIIHLTDGGIYDNLGFSGIKQELKKENTFIIVSDAAQLFNESKRKFNFISQLSRSIEITFEQNTIKDRIKIFNGLADKSLNGVYFTLSRSCRHYREYTNANLSIPTVPKDIPSDIGWSEAEVNLINKIRTDLDLFTDIEIDYLVYHGASLVDVSLRKWHPDIYQRLNLDNLNKPKYTNDEIKKLENSSKKLFKRK